MSRESDNKFELGSASANEPPSTPGWMVAGYALGVLSMALAPSLFSWFSATVSWFVAPLVPLLTAFACTLAGTMDRRVNAAATNAARGAVAAAVFGAVTVTVLFLGLAIIS